MIAQNKHTKQYPAEIQSAFEELMILKHLRTAGFKKRFGYPCSALFQLIFTLLFHHKNWFRLLESKKDDTLPGKDSVYRFLNHPGYAWRRFLRLLSACAIHKVNALTSKHRITTLIIDDSMFARNRSKSVEMLARFKDHATGCYYRGYRMLTLGWSDGHTFIPIDFALLSSLKSRINGIFEGIDKRTSGYKRRQEALQSAPEVIPAMVDRALSAGIFASHVLMDSWFTHFPLIQALTERGLDVIGMVKNDKRRYRVGKQRLTLDELYHAATPEPGSQKQILRFIQAELQGMPVKIVFVRHRSQKREWLAILCTDTTLTSTEIIRIYATRWDIEVFFKCTKSLLRLQKEFQGRSYDMMVSHTTVVFSRYIVLSWQHRCSTDDRTLGGLFLALCDEVNELDWAIALQHLYEIINQVAKKINKRTAQWVQRQLQQWIDGLPKYIKAYLPISCCES